MTARYKKAAIGRKHLLFVTASSDWFGHVGIGLAATCLGFAIALALVVWWLRLCIRRLAVVDEERSLLLECVEEAPTYFSVYSMRGELVTCNRSYRNLNSTVFDRGQQPVLFSDVIREVLRPTVAPALLEEEVAAMVRSHFNEEQVDFERKYPGERWHRIMRRRLSSGNVVAFAIDITPLKMREVAIADAVDRFERETSALAQTLSAQAEQLRQTAVTVAVSAASSTGRAKAVTVATQEAAGHVAKAAQASGELASSIASINGEVQRSVSATERAAIGARHADLVVHDLAESARTVGSVVDLISQIAGQTNLLALNASIEAARAGAAGQGFAVVAAEVKALASQTRQATSEIGDHIRAIRFATEQAVGAIKDITSMVDAVSASASTVAGVVEQQGSATTEIARTIHATLASTDTVLTQISGVSGSAGQITAAADAVLAAATFIADEAAGFSTQVGTFVSQIRAA